MTIKPIDRVLRPILDEFLRSDEYQSLFVEEARKLGYKGDDPEKIKVALFTPDVNNEICFASDRVAEAFVDFQILRQLSNIEPYKTLLIINPSVKPELLELSRGILYGKEVDVNAVLALFPQEETDK